MYEIILFDLDGTLTDPGEGITNSVAYAMKKLGMDIPGKTELYKFIGPPLIESFKKFCGFSDEKASLAVEYYREYFKEKGMLENTVYSGIGEMLDYLQKIGKKLIIATSKPELFTVKILEHFGLINYFDFISGATMDSSRSNKADIIKHALKSCNITDLSKAVMVGDREHDIIGAKKNGIDSIGVLFGYGSYGELKSAGATYIAENIEDICRIIENS